MDGKTQAKQSTRRPIKRLRAADIPYKAATHALTLVGLYNMESTAGPPEGAIPTTTLSAPICSDFSNTCCCSCSEEKLQEWLEKNTHTKVEQRVSVELT